MQNFTIIIIIQHKSTIKVKRSNGGSYIGKERWFDGRGNIVAMYKV